MRRVPVWTPALALLVLAAPAAAQTFQEEMARDLEEVRDKFLGLAEAMPASTYGWRPEDGVRSVSEVYMHIASANMGLPTNLIGASMPEGGPPAWLQQGETLTDKPAVIEALREGFDHLISVVRTTADPDLDRAAKVFGRDTNVRAALMLMQTHCHEHLGQSIAYARTNGVVPPWSS